MSARRPWSSEAWLGQARSGRWPFLFAEIALYDLVVLVATGIYLAVFFNPSMTRVIYHGSYRPLDGVPVSQAYESALHISFGMPGGLLIRQIHQWAALIFVAAVCLQLLQLFFTGGFRRPCWLHWLIWVALLPLGMVEGWTGSILPDDMLSGGSLSLLQAVLQSIPVVGTHLMLWVFGGAVPGQLIIPRFYWLHFLVLPLVMIGLLILARRLARRTGLTRQPGPPGSGWRGLARNPTVAGSLAMFFATCGVLTLLGTFAQIDPIWSIGPYQPGATTAPERCPNGTWGSSTARCGSCPAGRSWSPAIRLPSRCWCPRSSCPVPSSACSRPIRFSRPGSPVTRACTCGPIARATRRPAPRSAWPG